MNGKVIGSELKWKRRFRLRCVPPCDVRRMRKKILQGLVGGGWGRRRGVAKHQQWFSCNLCYFIHLSPIPIVCSDFRRSVESSSKCQELELKSSTSHDLAVSETSSGRERRWDLTKEKASMQTKHLKINLKVSRGWARQESFSFQIKMHLLTHGLDPTLWTLFFFIPVDFLTIPDEFHEWRDERSCSKLCILELITALTNDVSLLIMRLLLTNHSNKRLLYSWTRELTVPGMIAHGPYAQVASLLLPRGEKPDGSHEKPNLNYHPVNEWILEEWFMASGYRLSLFDFLCLSRVQDADWWIRRRQKITTKFSPLQ